MSKQLTLSAVLSVFAMAALALAMQLSAPEGGSRKATAHGSLVSVLLGA